MNTKRETYLDIKRLKTIIGGPPLTADEQVEYAKIQKRRSKELDEMFARTPPFSEAFKDSV